MLRRLALALVLFAIAPSRAEAQYIDLISPGPPATPSDYLELNFSFADTPYAIQMGLVTIVTQIVPLVNDVAHLRRDATWFPAFHRGEVSTTVFSAPLIATGGFDLNFAPELDAGFLAIDVAVSASYPVNLGMNARDVTITGPSGYMRSFTVQNIPEPSGAVLALAGCLVFQRRLVLPRRLASRRQA